MVLFWLAAFISILPIHAEEVVKAGDPQEEERSSCTPAQVEENKRILNYCEANWTKWGIQPKPEKSELLSTNECSGLISKDTASGCAQALLSFPIFLLDAGKMGAQLLFGDGPKTLKDKYQDQLDSCTRTRCGWAENDKKTITAVCSPEELARKIQEDGQNVENIFDVSYKCQEQKLAEYKAARPCFTNQSIITNCAKQPEALEIKNQISEESNIQAIITDVRQKCSDHMTQPMFRTPNVPELSYKDRVKNFNTCVEKEVSGNSKAREALLMSSDTLFDTLFNEIDSIQCYNAKTRRAFQCEIAMTFLSGGSTLAASVAKKLGKKGLKQLEKLDEIAKQKSAKATEKAADVADHCVIKDCDKMRASSADSKTIDHIHRHTPGKPVEPIDLDKNTLAKWKSLLEERNKYPENSKAYINLNKEINDLLSDNLSSHKIIQKDQTTFFPKDASPEQILKDFQNIVFKEPADCLTKKVAPTSPMCTAAAEFEYKGDRYRVFFCKQTTCKQSDGHEVVEGNVTTIYPVCGPDILYYQSIKYIRKEMDSAVLQGKTDLQVTPRAQPCP